MSLCIKLQYDIVLTHIWQTVWVRYEGFCFWVLFSFVLVLPNVIYSSQCLTFDILIDCRLSMDTSKMLCWGSIIFVLSVVLVLLCMALHGSIRHYSVWIF